MIWMLVDNIVCCYGVKLVYCVFVIKVILELFDVFVLIYCLDEYYCLLVEIVSKVDDIGNFISFQGYYWYFVYILEVNFLIGFLD